MNTFMNELQNSTNIGLTENGGITRKTTNSKVLDMFALGGSYRQKSDAEVVTLFSNAFAEDKLLALKCLFYLRDVRGGQGERRFFRLAFKWLCNNFRDIAEKNLINVSEYGRWDDLIYATVGTPCEKKAFSIIQHQLALDVKCKTPSLLAKWMPSQNASSAETKRLGCILANSMHMSSKDYRRLLSALREKINVLERLMSAGRWDEIEFDKIPSRAGLIYRNAFARRDILARKYEAFAKDTSTKVNAKTLYPNDIAEQAFSYQVKHSAVNSPNRLMLQKYWDNLPNYYGDREENGIAIVDVSGSMTGQPMNAAVSLGAYIAEKAHGPFANHFITFSAKPQLIKFSGVDITEKFNNCTDADWGMNTNIQAVFDMLLKIAKKQNVKREDMPTRLYIFSDMQFDRCVRFNVEPNIGYSYSPYSAPRISQEDAASDLENIKREWEKAGYKLPQIIFWNLNACTNNIPAIGEGFSYVSGFSPSMIECILGGKDGYDLMLEKLLSDRYRAIAV